MVTYIEIKKSSSKMNDKKDGCGKTIGFFSPITQTNIYSFSIITVIEQIKC